MSTFFIYFNDLKIFFKKRLTKFIICRKLNIVGVDDVEGTPVPIPNTVVKLNGAEDT